MALVRFPDWERRLGECLAAAAEKPFQWGSFDCALSACDCIQAITGIDPAAEIRGTYSTAEQVRKLFVEHGGTLESLATFFASRLEMPEVGPFYAHRGDVVLVNNETPDRALAIVDFSGRFARCASENGLARLAMKRWIRAWRVG